MFKDYRQYEFSAPAKVNSLGNWEKVYSLEELEIAKELNNITNDMTSREVNEMEFTDIQMTVKALTYLNGYYVAEQVSKKNLSFLCETEIYEDGDRATIFTANYGRDLNMYFEDESFWKNSDFFKDALEKLFRESAEAGFFHGDAKPHKISVDDSGHLRWFDYEYSYFYESPVKCNPFFYLDKFVDKEKGIWFNGEYNFRKNLFASFEPFDWEYIVRSDAASFSAFVIYAYNNYFNSDHYDKLYNYLHHSLQDFNLYAMK